MATELPSIGMLWIGPSLTWMEHLCMVSFLRQGHDVVLYSYAPVGNVPDGVRQSDASAIYPSEQFIVHKKTGSPACHADIFRIHMLQKTDHIWADTDAYCLHPWRLPDHGYFLGASDEEKSLVYNGVLRLPKSSPALASYGDFLSDEYAIPPWFSKKRQDDMAQLKRQGEGIHLSLLPWGATGPNALTHFLKASNETQNVFPPHVLYPLSFKETYRLFATVRADKDILRETLRPETVSIHFYGRRFRTIASRSGGAPPPNSYLDDLLRDANVDWTSTAHSMSHREKTQPRIPFKAPLCFDTIRAETLPQLARADVKFFRSLSRSLRRNPEDFEAWLAKNRTYALTHIANNARILAEDFTGILDRTPPRTILSAGHNSGFLEYFLHQAYGAKICILESEEICNLLRENGISEDDLVFKPTEPIGKFDAIICHGETPPDDIIDRLNECGVVFLSKEGFENLDEMPKSFCKWAELECRSRQVWHVGHKR